MSLSVKAVPLGWLSQLLAWIGALAIVRLLIRYGGFVVTLLGKALGASIGLATGHPIAQLICSALSVAMPVVLLLGFICLWRTMRGQDLKPVWHVLRWLGKAAWMILCFSWMIAMKFIDNVNRGSERRR